VKVASKFTFVTLAILGLLSMGPGSCKSVEVPNNNVSPSAGQPRSGLGEAGESDSGAQEDDEVNMHRFLMVYQSLMGGETGPCG